MVALAEDPAGVPSGLTLRTVAGAEGAEGAERYSLERYLRRRGDPLIPSVAALLERSTFFEDSSAGLGSEGGVVRRGLEAQAAQRALDTAPRMHRRFAIQQIVLACMAELNLDALAYPTVNLPPQLIGTPLHPPASGRNGARPSPAPRPSPS